VRFKMLLRITLAALVTNFALAPMDVVNDGLGQEPYMVLRWCLGSLMPLFLSVS
jgi:hypothetical protein